MNFINHRVARLPFLIIIMAMHAVMTFPADLRAQSSKDYIKVVSSDDTGLIIEIKTPEPDFEAVPGEGTIYHRIKVQGFASTEDAGSPQLPKTGALLGIPEGSIPTVEVLEKKERLLTGYKIHPAPKRVISEDGETGRVRLEFALNREKYNTNGFIPEELVKIDFTGFMREQKVARVVFSPFRYNPVTGELVYYSRIRIRVNFNDGASEQAVSDRTAGKKDGKVKDGAYEKLLKGVLLNYDQARPGSRR